MLSFRFMLPGDSKKLKLSLTKLPMASNENFHLEKLDVDLAWHQTSSLLQNFTPIVFLLIKPCLTSALRNNLFQDITSTHKQLHSVCPINIFWLLLFPVLPLLQMLHGRQRYRNCGVSKIFCWVERKGRKETEAWTEGIINFYSYNRRPEVVIRWCLQIYSETMKDKQSDLCKPMRTYISISYN